MGALDRERCLNCRSLGAAFVCGGTGSVRRSDASDGDWLLLGEGEATVTEPSIRGRTLQGVCGGKGSLAVESSSRQLVGCIDK